MKQARTTKRKAYGVHGDHRGKSVENKTRNALEAIHETSHGHRNHEELARANDAVRPQQKQLHETALVTGAPRLQTGRQAAGIRRSKHASSTSKIPPTVTPRLIGQQLEDPDRPTEGRNRRSSRKKGDHTARAPRNVRKP